MSNEHLPIDTNQFMFRVAVHMRTSFVWSLPASYFPKILKTTKQIFSGNFLIFSKIVSIRKIMLFSTKMLIWTFMTTHEQL